MVLVWSYDWVSAMTSIIDPPLSQSELWSSLPASSRISATKSQDSTLESWRNLRGHGNPLSVSTFFSFLQLSSPQAFFHDECGRLSIGCVSSSPFVGLLPRIHGCFQCQWSLPILKILKSAQANPAQTRNFSAETADTHKKALA